MAVVVAVVIIVVVADVIFVVIVYDVFVVAVDLDFYFVTLNLDLRLLVMEDEFRWVVGWWWLCGSEVSPFSLNKETSPPYAQIAVISLMQTKNFYTLV